MTNDCKTCPVSTGTHKPAEAVHVQIDEPQDEAMRLADECDESATHWVHEIDTRFKAAKMLRAQHARIEDLEAQHREELRAYEITVANREARIAELEGQLDAIGAGGVEPLRKPAAAPQAVQAAVPLPLLLRDIARDLGITVPEACNALKPLGNYSTNSAVTAEMARMLREHFPATAHPAESVPAQIETLRSELAEEKEAADNWRRLALQFDIHRLQALWHLKRILHADSSVDEYKAAEQFLAAPPLDGEAVLAQRIAALAATQPAAQGMEADLTDEQIDEAFNQMPDGATGFLKSWGYRQFARAVLAAQAKQGGA